MGSTRSARSSRMRRAALAGGAAVVLLGTAGCSSSNGHPLGNFGYPDPITEQGPTLLSFWQNAWVAALAVGFLTWGLIFWAIIAYRKSKAAGAPVQTRYNLPIEILYTVTPAIMIFALFAVTARDQAYVLQVDKQNKNVVGVVGWKWNWGFNYPEGAYDVGTPAKVADLYLKKDVPVTFTLNSPDVIHSFWVPQFLFKMDVIPGRTNEFQLTPNKEGVFAGKCAELCGTYHSAMLFNVHVVSAAEYDRHIAELKAKGQGGELKTGRIDTGGYAPSNTGVQGGVVSNGVGR